MSDFVEVILEDGSQVRFQTAESDLVTNHGGSATVDPVPNGLASIQTIAAAADGICKSLREKLTPDELTLEISVGVSGEVGWFFAKSEMEAVLKATISWRSHQYD